MGCLLPGSRAVAGTSAEPSGLPEPLDGLSSLSSIPETNLLAILFGMPLAATVRAFGGPMLSDAELDTPVPTKLLSKDTVLVGWG